MNRKAVVRPMIRITAPHFVAGIVVKNPDDNICSPIVKYMRTWPVVKILTYCRKKQWKYELL